MAWKCYECEHTNKGRNKTLCESCGMPFNVFADEAIKSRAIIQKLEYELNSAKTYSDIYYDEASSKDFEIEGLTNKLSQAIFENKNLETTINSQSWELSELNKKIISLNKQVNTRIEVNKRLSLDNETLSKHLEVRLDANKNLTISIESLQKKIKNLESEKLLTNSKPTKTSNEIKIIIGIVCLIIAFIFGKTIGSSSDVEVNPKINYAQLDSAAAIQPFILKDIYFENSAAPETFNNSFKSSELKFLQATLNIIPLSSIENCQIGFKIINPDGSVLKTTNDNFYTYIDTISIAKDSQYITLSGFGNETPNYSPGKYMYEVWLQDRHVGTGVFEVTDKVKIRDELMD